MAFTFAAFCYMLSLVLCAALIFFAIWHIIAFDELRTDFKSPIDQCNPVHARERLRNIERICFLLRKLVLPEYSIHSLFCIMFLCAQEWLTLGLNVPLLFYHFWRYFRCPADSSELAYDPPAVMNADTLSYCQKEAWCKLAFYLLSFFYYLYCRAKYIPKKFWKQLQQQPDCRGFRAGRRATGDACTMTDEDGRALSPQDEEYLPQMDEQNKTLKEKLVSRLRFEPERTEVLLMVKGGYIVRELADSSDKDNGELSSSAEKKCPILRTAVYRARTERKHKAATKEEGVCFGKVLARIRKEGREGSVCQPTSMSEHETTKLRRSVTKKVALMSENENFKKTLPTASASKGVQRGLGTSPPSPVYDNIRKTEMQTAVLEPSCHKKACERPKVERSSKKPLRTKVHSYDRTEAIDDDVIMHILRLRGKLGWQTKLPSCERSAREADVARLQKFTLKKPLLLKDSGEYIYCLQRNRNNFKAPYNPYDLQAVSTNTAMQNKEYWTVTASFVSKFSAGRKSGEMEITPVPQWLHERHLYYRLLNLNLFANFRMKKYFLVWKINVRRSKMNKTKSV